MTPTQPVRPEAIAARQLDELVHIGDQDATPTADRMKRATAALTVGALSEASFTRLPLLRLLPADRAAFQALVQQAIVAIVDSGIWAAGQVRLTIPWSARTGAWCAVLRAGRRVTGTPWRCSRCRRFSSERATNSGGARRARASSCTPRQTGLLLDGLFATGPLREALRDAARDDPGPARRGLRAPPPAGESAAAAALATDCNGGRNRRVQDPTSLPEADQRKSAAIHEHGGASDKRCLPSEGRCSIQLSYGRVDRMLLDVPSGIAALRVRREGGLPASATVDRSARVIDERRRLRQSRRRG